MRSVARPPNDHTVTAALTATFLAVLLVGAATTLVNPALLRWPPETLRDGAWARAYQAALDASAPLRPAAVALWNAVDLVVFGQAPAGVVLGADGWLFTEEEYAQPADPDAARGAWVEHLATVDARLAADGVRLVVALVPAKASLVDAGQPPLPRVAAERYDAVVGELAVLGVPVVDLRPALAALGDDAWLRTDTHWTPAGAQAAADAVAAHLRALDPDLAGDALVALEPTGTDDHEGDLLRLLELGALGRRIGPEPDTLERLRAVRMAPSGADLFAEVQLPLTVVGTSYAADERWHLATRLEAALGVEALDAAQVGRGPAAPMASYLDSAAYQASRPRVVVWEIPERYLRHPPEPDVAPVAGQRGPLP